VSLVSILKIVYKSSENSHNELTKTIVLLILLFIDTFAKV